jgi:hypothetical protein
MVVLGCAGRAGSASLLSLFERGQPSWSGGFAIGRRGRWRSTTAQSESNAGPGPGGWGESEMRLFVYVAGRMDGEREL